MAGATEGQETTTNGSQVSLDDRLAADRAAFLSGKYGEDDGAGDDGKEPAKDPVEGDDDADLDEDLDEHETELEDEPGDDDDEEREGDDDQDDDADLEDDDDKEPDAKVEPEVAKRLEQVRRTDKRLREQREAQFRERDAAFERERNAFVNEWKPKVEAAQKFERLAARVNTDPAAVLEALGLPPDRFEHASQVLFLLSKGKDDPKYREHAARLMKDRELADEIGELKKWREDRETTDRQRQEAEEADRKLEAYFGTVTKSATEKTPLAKDYLAKEPDAARADLARIAFKLAKEAGALPEPKKLMIELEKEQRRILRRYGVDPKSLKPASKADSKADDKAAAAKPGAKKPAKGKADTKADDDKPLTKEEFLRTRPGQYD